MERSRFSSPSKKLLRHAPRYRTCSPSILHALIALLLFCMLAIFHSKLSAANASNLARLFISPVTQRASDLPLLKPVNLPPRNGTGFREMAEKNLPPRNWTGFGELAERKFGKAQSWIGSHLSMQGGVEDEDMDAENDTDADVDLEVHLDDNAEEDEQQQKGAGEVEKEDKIIKQKKKDSVGDGIQDGVIFNSSVHASTWVRDRMTTLPGLANGESHYKISLVEHGVVKTLPRWDPLENIHDRGLPSIVESNESSLRSPRSLAIKWDHLLGVVRQVGSLQRSSTLLQSRKVRLHFKSLPYKDIRDGFFDNTHVYGSDDEPLDQNVIHDIESITTIDDALLFGIEKRSNGNLRSWTNKKVRADTYKKERSSKNSFDLLNPMNNPLLQDPDTSSSNGLSVNDRAMLKALQKANARVAVGSFEAEHGNADTSSFEKVSQDMLATHRKKKETFQISGDAGGRLGNAAERSILELSSLKSVVFSEAVGREENTDSLISKSQSPLSDSSKEKKSKSFLDTRKWGFYPGLRSNLAFSDFLEQFLEDEKCSHRVFMVWTTPPWTYTVRYQRGLESVLYFHPRACVVVFSITIDLDFFVSFVEQGFRVAVVVPNLEELLVGTPAGVFSSFWLPWTKTHFFHIHYSELLRLAALYKYGGIYLDTDVVLLKPLSLLHNSIGAEKVEDEARKLNGAVMAFDKNSVFLLECLVEFTATYDDQLSEFNGAALVTRVADRMRNTQKEAGDDYAGNLRVEEPHAFFPLSREDIIRYFKAPDSKEQQLETSQLLESIYNQSSMLHLWNQKTHSLVPEASSLVEQTLNRHCIKCDEYL